MHVIYTRDTLPVHFLDDLWQLDYPYTKQMSRESYRGFVTKARNIMLWINQDHWFVAKVEFDHYGLWNENEIDDNICCIYHFSGIFNGIGPRHLFRRLEKAALADDFKKLVIIRPLPAKNDNMTPRLEFYHEMGYTVTKIDTKEKLLLLENK